MDNIKAASVPPPLPHRALYGSCVEMILSKTKTDGVIGIGDAQEVLFKVSSLPFLPSVTTVAVAVAVAEAILLLDSVQNHDGTFFTNGWIFSKQT